MKLTTPYVILGTVALCLASAAGYLATASAIPSLPDQAPHATRLVQQLQARQVGMGPGMGARSGAGPDRLFEQLDLSPAQLEQIRAIRASSQETMEPLRDQVQSARIAMHTLMASQASSDQLRQQHTNLLNLEQQLKTKRFETMLQIRDVLTPEQRTELGQLLEQRHSQRRQNSIPPQ